MESKQKRLPTLQQKKEAMIKGRFSSFRKLYFHKDAPLGTFYRSGWPQQRLFIIPEWDIVIVRIGRDKNKTDRPADSRACWNTVLKMVGEAIVGVNNEIE